MMISFSSRSVRLSSKIREDPKNRLPLAVSEGAGLHACERAAQALLEDWERALARFAKYVPYRL